MMSQIQVLAIVFFFNLSDISLNCNELIQKELIWLIDAKKARKSSKYTLCVLWSILTLPGTVSHFFSMKKLYQLPIAP